MAKCHKCQVPLYVDAFTVQALEDRFGDLLATMTGVEWFKFIVESVTIVIGLICVRAFRRGIVGDQAAPLKKRQ